MTSSKRKRSPTVWPIRLIRSSATTSGIRQGVAPRHLVSIADLDAAEIVRILDHGDRYWALGSEPIKKLTSLRGRTVINLFFEASTRTRTSFELAAKRLSRSEERRVGKECRARGSTFQ